MDYVQDDQQQINKRTHRRSKKKTLNFIYLLKFFKVQVKND
jgi:hypothetical protein